MLYIIWVLLLMDYMKEKERIKMSKGKNIKNHWIIISKRFLTTHIRADEPTNFIQKIEDYEKIHTIRFNINHWITKINDVNNGSAEFTIRSWNNKPYRSKSYKHFQYYKLGYQIIFFKLNLDNPRVDNLEVVVDTSNIPFHELAKNDGLTQSDMFNWFLPYFKQGKNIYKIERNDLNERIAIYPGIIIHFTKFRYPDKNEYEPYERIEL